VDAQKNIKRYGDQIRESQSQVEEEQRLREQFREQYLNADKRVSIALSEKEDLAITIEQLDRQRRQLESDLLEAREQYNATVSQNSMLLTTKAKFEHDYHVTKTALGEAESELRAIDERAKRSAGDAGRLAEELRAEQEHAMHLERLRKSLEMQAKEMQGKLDDAESAVLKGGQKAISKLEAKLKTVEAQLETEQRRHQEAVKNYSKQDRRVRELLFQCDEDKKNFDRVTDLVEKLQEKIKAQKRALEETEELAGMNLAKYRQLQLVLEHAEERADTAENSLAKFRTKGRMDYTTAA